MNFKTVIFIIFLSVFHYSNGQELKVMSYNIRLDLASDNDNSWKHRKDFLSSQVLFMDPDILGVQEALPNQVADLKMALMEYEFIGLGRDGEQAGEHSGIYYKTDKLELEQSDTFWLSTTPDTVSMGWDAAYKRVCTYGLFQYKETESSFWVFNTHLDHVGPKAQREGMQLILSKMKSLNSQNYPVILMGDFNVEPDSEIIKAVLTELSDSRDLASVVFGPKGTFNDFKYDEPAARLIDYIMVSKEMEVATYGVLSSAINKKYPSDHFPVFVKLQM